ncbi:hypothetical protein AXE86_06010 [Selenomonas sp. oral taxon 136]|nr:hypothetical protein [Selenomonas sp. oral taxon 136]AME03659.1 hypothetical protein AXE86_06010 [Selenomonas sp. oral taxon 136]
MGVRNKNEPQRRDIYTNAIAIREKEDGGDVRQAELSLSSEEPCRRWFGNEILSHDAEAVDLSRLQEIGVVLFNHDRDRVIGRVLDVRLDEVARKLRATIQFDEDEESERIYQKVCSGTLRGYLSAMQSTCGRASRREQRAVTGGLRGRVRWRRDGRHTSFRLCPYPPMRR